MAIPLIPVALGGGALLLLLLSRNANAAPSPTPVNPGPAPGPGPSPAGPKYPPGSALAVVSVTTGEGGLNVRSDPSPAAQQIGSLSNGTTVAVLETDIQEQGQPADSILRWWRVIIPSGATGYVRAIGPMGEMNLQSTGPVALPRGGVAPPIAAGMNVGAAYRVPRPFPFTRQPLVPMNNARAVCRQPGGCLVRSQPGATTAAGRLLPGQLVQRLQTVAGIGGFWTQVRYGSQLGVREGWVPTAALS